MHIASFEEKNIYCVVNYDMYIFLNIYAILCKNK